MGCGEESGNSIFHSISAFCNAGIDLVGESSFAPFVTNPLMNVTTMGLIILSGLGFPVWWEVIEHVQDLLRGKRTRKNFIRGFTLHTKLVLTTTVILITGGALLILLLDWNHTGSLGDLKPGEKVMAAFFQSITTRTAGFETIPQKKFYRWVYDGEHDSDVYRRFTDGNSRWCEDNYGCSSYRAGYFLYQWKS